MRSAAADSPFRESGCAPAVPASTLVLFGAESAMRHPHSFYCTDSIPKVVDALQAECKLRQGDLRVQVVVHRHAFASSCMPLLRALAQTKPSSRCTRPHETSAAAANPATSKGASLISLRSPAD